MSPSLSLPPLLLVMLHSVVPTVKQLDTPGGIGGNLSKAQKSGTLGRQVFFSRCFLFKRSQCLEDSLAGQERAVPSQQF